MDAVALFKADKRSRLIPAGDESVSVLSCRQQLPPGKLLVCVVENKCCEPVCLLASSHFTESV